MILILFLILGIHDFRYAKFCVNATDRGGGYIACCLARMGDNDYEDFGRVWRGDESQLYCIRVNLFRNGWVYLGKDFPK